MESAKYTIGEVYSFRVKGVFGNYCELVDGNTTTYLQNTASLRIIKGQEVRCRVLAFTQKHPKIELVDLGEVIQKTAMLSVDSLVELLEKYEMPCSSKDLAKLLMAEDTEYTYEERCNKWIQRQVSAKIDLQSVRNACTNVLELSDLMALCSSEKERDMYQQRFTTLLEQLGYYVKAVDLINEENADEFLQDVMSKLNKTGYLYHPNKNINILAALFVLKPELMKHNITNLLDVVEQWQLEHWEKEPFNALLIKVLENYVATQEDQIDKAQSGLDLVGPAIRALGTQLLLAGKNHAEKEIDYSLNSSRLCVLASYMQSMVKPMGLVNYAVHNLLGEKPSLPVFNLTAAKNAQLPFYMQSEAEKIGETISTISAYIKNKVQLRITSDGIHVMSEASGGDVKGKPAIPQNIQLWHGLQVYLDKKLNINFENKHDSILPYKMLWEQIEIEMFKVADNKVKTPISKKKHKIDEEVEISIVSQDEKDINKFYCNIEDEIGGTGYIYLSDIVSYIVNASLRHFISNEGQRMIFNAKIIDKEDDLYHFEIQSIMREMLRESQSGFYEEDEEFNCMISSSNLSTDGRLIGVSQDGLSVSISGCFGQNLNKGEVVTVRNCGTGFGVFLANAEYVSKCSSDFYLPEAFHNLMKAYSEKDVVNAVDIENEEEFQKADRMLDVNYVKQLIRIIDRVAMLDGDYVKAYNYLGFAKILSMLIGWESRIAFYTGRMDVISMLHDFATNETICQESLEEFERVNGDLFLGNSVLRDSFNKLQIVSYLGKPEYNSKLWEGCSSEEKGLSRLSQMVLAYNILKVNGLNPQANDVHNEIKNTLHLKSYMSGLRMYGSGSEDMVNEYKTSLVFESTGGTPNLLVQTNAIMVVIDEFLNAAGGTLYLGVNDQGMGVGLDNDLERPEFHGDKDKYVLYLMNTIQRELGNEAVASVDAKFDDTNLEKDVLVVRVVPLKNGVPYRGVWYVRATNRKSEMTKEEYTNYNSLSRKAILASYQGQNVLLPEIPSASEQINSSPEPEKTFISSNAYDAILTSKHRRNVLEDYQDDFVQPVAYLQMLEGNKFQKVQEYRYDPKLLTLAVYENEVDGYLILGYDNATVAKVPVRELLSYDDSRVYSRFPDANLIFASIASAEDALLLATKDSKKQKVSIRVDDLSKFEERKLTSKGEVVCNQDLFTDVVLYEIIPAAQKSDFKFVSNFKETTTGSVYSDGTKARFNDPLKALKIELSILINN